VVLKIGVSKVHKFKNRGIKIAFKFVKEEREKKKHRYFMVVYRFILATG